MGVGGEPKFAGDRLPVKADVGDALSHCLRTELNMKQRQGQGYG